MTERRKPKNPHDALFSAVFETPAHMAEELAAALPPEISAAIDLRSLQPEPGSFVDANLEGAETDLLFSANTAVGSALVYVLVEHQSSPDRHMPLRLLRYVGRILDAYRRREPDSDLLPPVLPLVIHHADRPWPYPLDMVSLYSVRPIPPAWAPHVIDFRFVLDDLARTPALSLTARPVSPLVAITLFLFKRARYATNLLAELEEIKHVLGQLDASPPPDEQRSALITYTWAVGGVEVSEMGDFVRKHTWPNLEHSVMTTAEKLMAQGHEKGLEKGLEEGRQRMAQSLLKRLRAKFGAAPQDVEEKIAAADFERLDRWLERLMTAETPRQVVDDE